MFLAITSLHDHMCPMRQRDADHSVDMVHINASDVIPWVRVIKQGEVPEISSFEPCFSICFRIFVSFHNIFSHLIQRLGIQERNDRYERVHPFTDLDERCLCVYISMMKRMLSITFL
jgi:hypothetical protein